MKKKLVIGAIVIILLISLLPYPQKIDRTYYGVNTENDELVDISVNMKYLRFLFLNDKMHGTITVKTEKETFIYGKHLHYVGQSSMVNNASDYAHDFNGWYYNDAMYMKKYENGTSSQMPVGFEGVLVHMSSDFSKILILHDANGVIETQQNARYIGSAEQNQTEKAKQYFSGYYD